MSQTIHELAEIFIRAGNNVVYESAEEIGYMIKDALAVTKCDHFDKFIGIMIPQSGETGQVCENAKFPFCPKCGEKL